MSSYQVKSYMSKDIVTIDAGESAATASKVMKQNSVGHLIVLRDGQPVGMVTEHDLVVEVMAGGKDPSKVQVSDFMSTPLVTVDPDASIEDAVKTMVDHGLRRLAVVRDDILYGVFTARDLAQHFNEYEERVTRDIIRNMSMMSLPY